MDRKLLIRSSHRRGLVRSRCVRQARQGSVSVGMPEQHERQCEWLKPGCNPPWALHDEVLCGPRRRLWTESFRVYAVRKIRRQLRGAGIAVARCTGRACNATCAVEVSVTCATSNVALTRTATTLPYTAASNMAIAPAISAATSAELNLFSSPVPAKHGAKLRSTA